MDSREDQQGTQEAGEMLAAPNSGVAHPPEVQLEAPGGASAMPEEVEGFDAEIVKRRKNGGGGTGSEAPER